MSTPISGTWHEHARASLVRQLQRSPQPTRLIHQWHAADLRCAAAQKILRRLVDQSPRIVGVVRHALRQAFDLDPATLLFTEQLPAPQPPRVDTLLARALVMLRRGLPLADIDAFTRLSIQGDEQRTVAFTAHQALQRVAGLKLSDRLEQAAVDYWQQLAFGSALTRQARWRQLFRGFLADKAILARGLGELTDEGLDMVQRLMDAPTPQLRQHAGGDWMRLEVLPVAWATSETQRVMLGGALHLRESGSREPQRQVIFLPGLAREFHEFSSREALDHELAGWHERPQLAALWLRLPLARRHLVFGEDSTTLLPLRLGTVAPLLDDALDYSADHLIATQWASELAAVRAISMLHVLPPPGSATRGLSQVERARASLARRPSLRVHLACLMERDAREHAAEIHFSVHRPDVPWRLQEAWLKRHEQGLLALLDMGDLAQETEGYRALLELQVQWEQQRDAVRQILAGQTSRLVEREFWLEVQENGVKRASLLLAAQRAAWLAEGQAQRRLGLIDATHLEALTQVLGTPLDTTRGGTHYRVAQISIGMAGAVLYWLTGVFVLTTTQGMAAVTLKQPVLLCMPGTDGGMVPFVSLDAVSTALAASFRNRDHVLWQCIGRRERAAARAMIEALGADEKPLVYYNVNEGDVLSDGFKEQIKQHYLTYKWVTGGGRPFSELSDLALTRQMLAAELDHQLQLPLSAAREQALGMVRLLRTGSVQAKSLPSWLAAASKSSRKRYQREQSRYLHSALAWEQTQQQILPDLEIYARRALIAQLTRDGFYPDLDIDQPLFDIPDDVSSVARTKPVGDFSYRLVPSVERTTFSLLELALHNLDAEAPWTRWRLGLTRYLDPAWKSRLNADYLIRTISVLDLGGRYEQTLKQIFYPPYESAPVLLQRPVEQRMQWALSNAREQGLSTFAQQMFATAASARTPQDLQRNGYRLQFCSLRLVGHTLAHDRHIAGMLVLQDRVSGRCVLYWPGAPEHRELTEHAGIGAACHALLGWGATPAGVTDLAHRVAPGWEAQAVGSYPGNIRWQVSAQAVVTDMAVRIRSTSWWEAMFEVFGAVGRWFGIKRSHPANALKAVEDEIREQIDAAPRHWLAVVPVSACDLQAWLVHGQLLGAQRAVRARAGTAETLKAYRQWRRTEQREAQVRAFLAAVPPVPIIGLGIQLYEVFLTARRFHQHREAADVVDLVFQVWLLLHEICGMLAPSIKIKLPTYSLIRPAVTRIRQHLSLLPRAPSTPKPRGGGLGSYRRSLSIEEAVERRGPGNQGLFVKNGEEFLVDGADSYPIYRRRGEQHPRLKSPGDDGQNELVLYIEEPRQWLLGGDPPASPPMPGTSLRRPWETAVTGQGWRPPEGGALQRVSQQAVVNTTEWQGWGLSMANDALTPLPGPGRLHRVQGSRIYDVVRLGNHYYELLPGGGRALTDVVFIKRNAVPARYATNDLARWLAAHSQEQPIPMTLGRGGAWTPRMPLFDGPLVDSIRAAFPGINPSSAYAAGIRLVELADTPDFVTATRMLNVRATLDGWLPPAPGLRGQTDDLFRLLIPQNRSAFASTNIGSEVQGPEFSRLDFRVPGRVTGGQPGATPDVRSQEIFTNLRQVLEGQGFTVTPFRKGNSLDVMDIYATHPRSTNFYYIGTRWAHTSSVSLGVRGSPILSDAWFEHISHSSMAQLRRRFAPVWQAKEQGRLVRILGGIQQAGGRDPTIFFIRVTGD